MNVNVHLIDSAVPGSKLEMCTVNGDEAVRIPDPDPEYRYLAAIPIGEDGSLWPCCSKDLRSWEICFGAYVDGSSIDLATIMEEVPEDD